MRNKLAKLLMAFALPIGLTLVPVAAHAAETPPPSQVVQCANAKAQLASLQAQLTADQRLVSGYQNTINSLVTARSKVNSESASYASLTTQINYYQNLINGLNAQESGLFGQIIGLEFYLFCNCGGPFPFAP